MDADVCIVGGGIMGLATACAISRASEEKIVLLDRYGVSNQYCSSNDVNRVFRYAYGNDEQYTRMAVESLRLWRDIEKETGQQLLVQTGLLMLQGEDKAANKFDESSFKTLTRLGLGANVYEGPELRKRFPQFNAAKGFFDPHGGVLLASRALKAFESQSASRGVRIIHTEAMTIDKKSRLEARTSDGGSIRAKKLVLTAGPWSGRFVRRELIRITPTRQQLIYLKPQRNLESFGPGSCPVFFTDYHYGLPAAGIDAVKISNKELKDPVDPETANRSVDQEQIDECRDVCREFVPDLADGAVFQTKVCLYDMTENSDFVIDNDPNHHDIVYGYGFSGHGFKFAPLIGRLLADLVLEREPIFNLSRFSARYTMRRPPMLRGHLGKGE